MIWRFIFLSASQIENCLPVKVLHRFNSVQFFCITWESCIYTHIQTWIQLDWCVLQYDLIGVCNSEQVAGLFVNQNRHNFEYIHVCTRTRMNTHTHTQHTCYVFVCFVLWSDLVCTFTFIPFIYKYVSVCYVHVSYVSGSLEIEFIFGRIASWRPYSTSWSNFEWGFLILEKIWLWLPWQGEPLAKGSVNIN